MLAKNKSEIPLLSCEARHVRVFSPHFYLFIYLFDTGFCLCSILVPQIVPEFNDVGVGPFDILSLR